MAKNQKHCNKHVFFGGRIFYGYLVYGNSMFLLFLSIANQMHFFIDVQFRILIQNNGFYDVGKIMMNTVSYIGYMFILYCQYIGLRVLPKKSPTLPESVFCILKNKIISKRSKSLSVFQKRMALFATKYASNHLTVSFKQDHFQRLQKSFLKRVVAMI